MAEKGEGAGFTSAELSATASDAGERMFDAAADVVRKESQLEKAQTAYRYTASAVGFVPGRTDPAREHLLELADLERKRAGLELRAARAQLASAMTEAVTASAEEPSHPAFSLDLVLGRLREAEARRIEQDQRIEGLLRALGFDQKPVLEPESEAEPGPQESDPAEESLSLRERLARAASGRRRSGGPRS